MEWTLLFTRVQLQQLRVNHDLNEIYKGTSEERDHIPVVRLFNPIGVGTWILSECSPDGLAFGLCDLGYPELGYVDLNELTELRLPGGLKIERDLHWSGTKPLSQYAEEARLRG